MCSPDGKVLLGVGSSEIGMSTTIVPITLQLALIGFFPIENPFIIKMPVNLNEYRETVGTNLRYVTNKRLCTINFTTDNIEKIIVSLNPNKAHGHDNRSIHMLKMCRDTICKPLELIFKQALTTGVFTSEWKKGSIVPC